MLVQLSPLADRVAITGRLDLNDIGAVVAEHAANEWAGQQLTDFQYTKSVQGGVGMNPCSCFFPWAVMSPLSIIVLLIWITVFAGSMLFCFDDPRDQV